MIMPFGIVSALHGVGFRRHVTFEIIVLITRW